ncbi:MAG: hypothetical protein QM519_04640 [Bacteroidia bacterium]|nr:hypothetical protein [Bacteroidia bacterium]
MTMSHFAMTGAALLAAGLAASSEATLLYVRSSTVGSSTVWTSYASLEDMAANTGGTNVGSSSSILSTDGVFTDGTYVYKTTKNDGGLNYNNTYVRYNSLADLNADSGGFAIQMTQGMYYNEDVIANTTNGWFFRTASFDSAANVGMYAFNTAADLVNNSYFYAAGFGGGNQNGDNRYWAGTGSTCWRSDVVNGVVQSFSVFASGPDLYNNTPFLTVASSAGYGADVNFMTIDSSLIPAPGAMALLAVAGVSVSRRRRA